MRADRLLSIVWLLRAHGRLTTGELARRLEVSRRTILRDVDALSTAGVPVYCERGPHGGVELLPGYRTDVSALTSEESRALFAAVTTWGADSLGLGDALASGLRKLLAAVPETHRGSTSEVASRIVVDPQGWLPPTERERIGETFRTIQEAVFSRRRLRVAYRSRSQAAARAAVAEPHGLVSAGSSWYLCATCDDDLRFIKLSRIDAAEMLPEACRDERVVDVSAAWRERRDRFREGFEALDVIVWVRDERGGDVREWAIRAEERSPADSPPGEGWTCFDLEFVDRLHALSVLLRLGPDARIVAPAQLKDELVGYLQATLVRYD